MHSNKGVLETVICSAYYLKTEPPRSRTGEVFCELSKRLFYLQDAVTCFTAGKLPETNLPVDGFHFSSFT